MNPFAHSEIVIASDLHLRDPNDQNYQLALQSLQQIKESNPSYLILLGDVFDFYLGSKSYFLKKYLSFSEALEQVSNTGTKVVFIEGNHEFHLSESKLPGVIFPESTDYIVKTKKGAHIKLCHGDLINAPASYLWFRKLIKSNWVKFLVKFMPARWLDAYALTHAGISRSRDQYRTLDHKALLADAKRWLNADGLPKVGVFGHFHHPYHEVHDDHTLMSLDSWHKPNFLLYRDNKFERIYLKD